VITITKANKPKDAVVELVKLEEKLAAIHKGHIQDLLKVTRNLERTSSDALKLVQGMKKLIITIERYKAILEPRIYYTTSSLGLGDLDEQLALLKKGKLPCPRCERVFTAYKDASEIEASLEQDGHAYLICDYCGEEVSMEEPESEDLLF
jgi:hypothetical protein